MAEGGHQSVRQEWHGLLLHLKSTSEGLLATHSSNVWNTYGGLDRICKDVEAIMNHRLKVTQGPNGSSLDFWNFVRGLHWLNPTMAPTIEQYHKMTRGGSTLHQRASGRTNLGKMWLRQSLLDHNLSNQLHVLVGNRQYVLQHYEGDGYLCQQHYFQAMVLCLNAVEQNKAALLADINPILLSRNAPNLGCNPKKSVHTRSNSLPTNTLADAEMLRRRKSQENGHLIPPPTRTLKTGGCITTTRNIARPRGIAVYAEESAADALRNVLNRSGDCWEDDDIEVGVDSEILNDPLMNMQILPQNITRSTFPPKSASFSNLNSKLTSGDSSIIKKSQSRTAGLLDSILNDDEYLTKTLEYKLPKRGSHDNLQADESDDVPKLESVSNASTQSLNVLPSYDRESKQFSASKNHNSEKTADEPHSTRRLSHKRSTSDVGVRQPKKHNRLHRNLDSSITEDSSNNLSSSLPTTTEDDVKLHHRRKEGVFRKPAKGQSLMSFLSSQDFHTCAELDKENAHFTLAEGLISAIEQMKWNQVIRPQRVSDNEYGDSDEEIQQLKQRIRIRRRERLKEKAQDFPAFFEDKMETMAADTVTTTTTTSTSPLSSCSNFSSVSPDSSSASSDSVHDTDITEADNSSQTTLNNLANLKESGLSLSMASLYSEVENKKSNANMEKALERQNSLTESSNTYNGLLSAESVAIALLSKFSEKQLPKASELDWLVSEQDAPQQLLPLPDSYPISPDDSEGTRLRGNLEWAPPRAQIIFNIHPAPKRKAVLARQNFRCAGCGAKVEPGYAKRYHYCEYLGKYFCPCCHSNDMTYIPGRILRRWDFTKFPVSNFARDLLQRIHKDPLFNIRDINDNLYRKVRPLQSVRESRIQLGHLNVFLKTCRLGQKQMDKLHKLPTHWMNDIHFYSIAELVEIKKNEHLSKIKHVVSDCINHTNQCPLCQAKGFICEGCRNAEDIIFPFEIHKVKRCPTCKACFHKECYISNSCPKCARIETRKYCLEVELSKEEEEISSDNELNVPSNQQIISR